MIKTVHDPKGTYAMVSVPVNYESGSISKTGKSFVYRIKGTYIGSNGEIKGNEGQYSPYLSQRLPFVSKHAGSFLPIDHAVMFDFDGVWSKAFKIKEG